MEETPGRLIKKAEDCRRTEKYDKAISLLARACTLLTEGNRRDYASAASVQNSIGQIFLLKQGQVADAVAAFLSCAQLYDRAQDKKASMAIRSEAAYMCIRERFYWDALFLFECLCDYYVKRDRFRCSRYAHDACLCLIVHNQVEDLTCLFSEYQSHLASEKEKETITKLHYTYKNAMPVNREEWVTHVFSFLSTSV